MTFVQAFVTEVEAQYSGPVPLWFGQADAPDGTPFVVVLVVPPASETPELFEHDSGEGGSVTLQFSLAAKSFPEAYDALELIKAVAQNVRGVIGDAPTQFYVNANRTTGVASLDASLGTWSAIFESTLEWSSV